MEKKVSQVNTRVRHSLTHFEIYNFLSQKVKIKCDFFNMSYHLAHCEDNRDKSFIMKRQKLSLPIPSFAALLMSLLTFNEKREITLELLINKQFTFID